MARIKMECSYLQELNYSTRVRLKVVHDENETTDSELAHQGSLTLDITNPAPPVNFERGRAYYFDITPADEN